MTDQSTVAASWHEVAPARVPNSVHVVTHGQTLPSIAELLGHPGEWLALFHHNVPVESRDKISPDALPVGVWLEIPPDWRAATGAWAPFRSEVEARAWAPPTERHFGSWAPFANEAAARTWWDPAAVSTRRVADAGTKTTPVQPSPLLNTGGGADTPFFPTAAPASDLDPEHDAPQHDTGWGKPSA